MLLSPRGCLIRSVAAYGGILCLALVSGVGAQPQSANPAKPGDEETPARKVLTGDDAKRAAGQVAGLPRGEQGPLRPRPAAAPAHPYEHPYYWAGSILIGDPK